MITTTKLMIFLESHYCQPTFINNKREEAGVNVDCRFGPKNHCRMQKMAKKILQNCRNLGCLQMQNFQRKKLQNVEFGEKKVVDLQNNRAGVDVEFDNFECRNQFFKNCSKCCRI